MCNIAICIQCKSALNKKHMINVQHKVHLIKRYKSRLNKNHSMKKKVFEYTVYMKVFFMCSQNKNLKERNDGIPPIT